MKRKSILVAVCGVLCILGGSIASFVESFANDVSSVKEDIEVIEIQYTLFKDLLESFNGEREILYNEVINNLYIEDVVLKYEEWIRYFQEYEKTVDHIGTYRDMLETKCFGVLYSDSSVQSKCDSMLISYETAVNYYVKDVEKLNTFLNIYNERLTEEEQVLLYDLGEYNYIDFNDDGNYLGN